jgi:hypothetical protein
MREKDELARRKRIMRPMRHEARSNKGQEARGKREGEEQGRHEARQEAREEARDKARHKEAAAGRSSKRSRRARQGLAYSICIAFMLHGYYDMLDHCFTMLSLCPLP